MKIVTGFVSLILICIYIPAYSQVQISPTTYTISGQSGYRVAKIGNVSDSSWVSEQNGIVTLSTVSGDIWWNADNFKFLYLEQVGDVEVTAKLDTLASSNSWTKLGLMARESLDPDDKNFLVLVRPHEGSFVQYRTTKATNAEGAWQGHLSDNDLTDGEKKIKKAVGYFKTPSWFRLVKKGSTFELFSSTDGLCWDKRYEKQISTLSTARFYGIALSSGGSSITATSTFENAKIIPAPSDVNRECERAKEDSWATPTNWVIPNATIDSNVQWKYRTTNPDPNAQFISCYHREISDNHQDGPSDPSCLNNLNPIPWTQQNYNDSTWQTGVMGFGRTNNPEINENSAWDSDNLWLRKEFNLSSISQINDLVFWGKWSQGISVYLNGVLAYSNYGWTANYGYRSFYPGARAALNIGNNVIAIRVKAQNWSSMSNQYAPSPNFYGFIDVGLALNHKTANIPMHVGSPPINSDIGRIGEGIREMVSLHGVPGAAFSVEEDSQILGSWSYGYRTPQLTDYMPADAILRLASNDKPISRSIIVELIERDQLNPNGLKPHTKYFEFLNNPNA